MILLAAVVWPSRDELADIVRECASYGHASKGVEVYDIGTGPFLEYLEKEILDGFVAKGGSAIKFITGNSGAGKTHVLKLIENLALRKGYAVAVLNLNTSNNFRDWMAVTKEIVSKIKISRDGASYTGINEILEYFSRFEGAGEKMFDINVRHPCYRRAMQYMLVGKFKESYEGSEHLGLYLKGERITVSQFRKCGIKRVKKPLDRKNAEAVLSTMLNSLPNVTDMDNDPPKGTVIIFDETDNTWDGRRRALEDTANHLRRMVDSFKNGDVRNTFAVFGVLPAFFDGCIHYQALSQRLDRPPVNSPISWRSTVLSVSDIDASRRANENLAQKRELFVRDLAGKCIEIVERCDGNVDGAEEELVEAGMESLNSTAGEEFRRQIIKNMMARVSIRIEEEND